MPQVADLGSFRVNSVTTVKMQHFKLALMQAVLPLITVVLEEHLLEVRGSRLKRKTSCVLIPVSLIGNAGPAYQAASSNVPTPRPYSKSSYGAHISGTKGQFERLDPSKHFTRMKSCYTRL